MARDYAPIVKRLPKPEWPERTPACQGKVTAIVRDWHLRDPRFEGDPQLCTAPARWQVDGKLYCTRHGGAILLAELAE